MVPINVRLDNDDHSTGNDIKYIVIHDTGNYSDSDEGNANYFCTGSRGSSAHYFVDEDSITQIVLDQYASWHCGDGYMKNGIGNHNSLGVEMCKTNGVVSAATLANTIDLVRKKMAEYSIPKERVVRHFDASGKICPGSMYANNWAGWASFKAKLMSVSTVLASAPIPKQIYRVRTAYNNVASQIGAYTDLANAKACVDAHPGYVVYDSSFNQVCPSVAFAPAAQYGTVTASVLNVRRSGSTSAEIIGTLTKGQKVKIDRIAGDWVSIYFGDHGGYVYKSYLSIS